ncbi:hypothetical protein VNO77_03553 [Canavalia gladiata]|uniref:Uncharacterized protein n=1 Tax=Canavalia gladiata TaxID=3824 RepID=A0AAN9MUY0_CANGL
MCYRIGGHATGYVPSKFKEGSNDVTSARVDAERKSYGFWYVSIVEIRSKQGCRHGSKHTCDARDGWETQAPPMECNSSLCSPSYGLLSGFVLHNYLFWD